MKTRIGIAVLDGFLSVTALAGALMIVPGLPREWLAGSIFPDYVVPALALGIAVGGSALVAAVAVLFWGKLGAAIAAISAVMIASFEGVEITTIGYEWLQAVYLMLGVTIAGLALRLWVVEGGYIPSIRDLRRHHQASLN